MAAYDNVEMPRAPTQYGPPLANFGAQIAALPDAYYQGAEMKRDFDLKRVFQGGLPRVGNNPNGEVDVNGAIDKVARLGGMNPSDLVGLSLRQQAIDADRAPLGGQPPAAQQPQPQSQPAPFNPQRKPQLSARGTDNEGADTVRSMTTEIFGGRDVLPIIQRVAKGFGVDPDAPLAPQQVQQIKTRLSQAAGQAQQNPIGSGNQTPTGDGGMQPVQAGGQVSAPQPMERSPLVPHDWRGTDLQFVDEAFRRARSASIGGMNEAAKIWQSRGQAVLEDLKQRQAPTNEDKLARSSGYNSPLEYERAKNEEAKLYGGVAEAKGKRIGEVIEAGGTAARHTLNVLDTMEDSFRRGGTNISTGPGAEAYVKVKQAVQNLFPNLEIKGLQESEVIKKLNAQLASASAKALTARPSQLEFKTFVANNPGIETSLKGTQFLIGVLKQATEQDIALSRKAFGLKNFDNWHSIEDDFYKKNPIRSPFTGKVLRGDEIIAPAAAGPATNLPRPANAIERDKLKPGSQYVAPDGSVRVRQ